MVHRWESDPLDGLLTISVDERSYRRHDQYVTVVVDHGARRIVWAREGKDTATLKAYTTARPKKAARERLGHGRYLMRHV